MLLFQYLLIFYLQIYHNTIKIRFEVHIFQVSRRRLAFGNFRRCDVTSRVNHMAALQRQLNLQLANQLLTLTGD